MRYLLDTHTWVWAVLGDRRLSRRARAIVSRLGPSRPAGLASISLKEAAWHLVRGRIAVTDGTWQDWLRAAASAEALAILPLTHEVAIASEEWSAAFPADPADRLIAATAQVHRLVLITADEGLRDSDEIETTW